MGVTAVVSTIIADRSPEIILVAQFFFFILASFLSWFFELIGQSEKTGVA
jgi:hypothetical protein